MSNILVTGGGGFIGSNLCSYLLKQGNRVIAVDNFITSSSLNIKQLLTYQRFTFIKHDITKSFPKSIRHQISGIRYIYHLACPTGVSNLERLAEEMLLTCSIGTQNILELARENNAKVLFTSSSEIYGNPQEFPQHESYSGNVDPIGFRSPYEEGKRFSESLILMYVRKYAVDAKIVRVFNTYGPGSSVTETRVVPRFIRLALSQTPLIIEGKGSQTRTFCYVEDLVQGLIMVMKKGKTGDVYNLGGEKEIKIIDVAKLIIMLTESRSKIKFITRPKHDHDRRLPDLSKIKKLGWKQTISLQDGIKRTLGEFSQI